jgi:hypothetical protein
MSAVFAESLEELFAGDPVFTIGLGESFLQFRLKRRWKSDDAVRVLREDGYMSALRKGSAFQNDFPLDDGAGD